MLKNSISSKIGNELILVKLYTCYRISMISCPTIPFVFTVKRKKKATARNGPHETSRKFSTLNLVIITSHGTELLAEMWESGPLSGKNEERGKHEISENEYSSTKLQVIQISKKHSDDR